MAKNILFTLHQIPQKKISAMDANKIMGITLQKAKDLEQGINQGVVMPTPEEELASGILDLSQFPQVSPDGNNDKFLSDFDAQYSLFDTLLCNFFASIGMSEVNINSMGGDPDYGAAKVEFSERYSGVMGGGTGLAGTSEQQWRDSVSNFGLVGQGTWPWTPGMTREQYFASIPSEVVALGQKFLKKYESFPYTVGIDKASLKQALKYGAVKIFIGTGPGWNVAEPNVVPVNTGAMNHAVMLRYIDDKGYHIRDHYAPFLKLLHPDYRIFYASQTLYKKRAQLSFVFMRDLWYGLSDPDCIHLQLALQNDGEFPQHVAFDEHFGQKTLVAVQKFQVKNNIVHPGQEGYGRVGPKTRAVLNKLTIK